MFFEDGAKRFVTAKHVLMGQTVQSFQVDSAGAKTDNSFLIRAHQNLAVQGTRLVGYPQRLEVNGMVTILPENGANIIVVHQKLMIRLGDLIRCNKG